MVVLFASSSLSYSTLRLRCLSIPPVLSVTESYARSVPKNVKLPLMEFPTVRDVDALTTQVTVSSVREFSPGSVSIRSWSSSSPGDERGDRLS